MLKILIVENDVLFGKELKKELEKLNCVVIAICRTADEAIEKLTSNKIELALLDIELDGKKNGIDVAKHINRINRIPFIYLSVNNGIGNPYFMAANSTKPANYLPKGFLPKQLSHFIEMALVQYANIENGVFADGQANYFIYDELFVKEQTGGKWKKIIADEITHISVAKPLCKIWVNNNTKAYTVRASLDEVMQKFKNPQLIRIHQSHAVQIYFIDKYDAQNSQVILTNGLQLSVGRTYKNELSKHIMFLE
jgi:two-component system, LytTR family, response regulator LytT